MTGVGVVYLSCGISRVQKGLLLLAYPQCPQLSFWWQRRSHAFTPCVALTTVILFLKSLHWRWWLKTKAGWLYREKSVWLFESVFMMGWSLVSMWQRSVDFCTHHQVYFPIFQQSSFLFPSWLCSFQASHLPFESLCLYIALLPFPFPLSSWKIKCNASCMPIGNIYHWENSPIVTLQQGFIATPILANTNVLHLLQTSLKTFFVGHK